MRYIPKISKVIDPFLRRTLFKPFVFPNCIPVSISNREVKNLREAGKLLRYGQRARNVEGSLAVCVRVMRVAGCARVMLVLLQALYLLYNHRQNECILFYTRL